jgi:NAD(P)-dependent dehydrogenase (short-subunit alcohol dehydrogenase family)
LAQAGVTVALVATDGVRLARCAEEIRRAGGQAIALPADITDQADIDRAVAFAQQAFVGQGFAGIDLLVNAAGIIDAEVPLWEADPDQWWRTMNVNVRGPFLLARAVVPDMIARGGGRIVDLNSGSGSHVMSASSAYNVSKTALMRLGEHLHVAGFDQGIRVFEVAPGVVATDMTASMPMHEGRTEWTPVNKTVDMVTAIASGTLDACSGWFIRVTDDSPASLLALTASGQAAIKRRLRVLPAGADDALADTLTGR